MLRATPSRKLLVTLVRHSESVNNVLNHQMKDKPRAFALRKLADPPLTDRGVKQAELVAQRLAAEDGQAATLILTSFFHRSLRTAAAIEDRIRAENPSTAARVVVDRAFHEVGGSYVSTAAEASEDLVIKGTPGRTTAELATDFPTFVPLEAEHCHEGWWNKPHKETLTEARARALTLWGRLAKLEAQCPLAQGASFDAPFAPSVATPAPEIVPIRAHGGGHAQSMSHGLRGHRNIIVVTHGWLYQLMMNEAKNAGLIDGETPESYSRLSNTAITRVEIVPPPQHANAAGVRLRVLMENCNAHVAQIGALESSVQPLH
jgi:broad specificity phosphatase PhoE